MWSSKFCSGDLPVTIACTKKPNLQIEGGSAIRGDLSTLLYSTVVSSFMLGAPNSRCIGEMQV